MLPIPGWLSSAQDFREGVTWGALAPGPDPDQRSWGVDGNVESASGHLWLLLSLELDYRLPGAKAKSISFLVPHDTLNSHVYQVPPGVSGKSYKQ